MQHSQPASGQHPSITQSRSRRDRALHWPACLTTMSGLVLCLISPDTSNPPSPSSLPPLFCETSLSSCDPQDSLCPTNLPFLLPLLSSWTTFLCETRHTETTPQTISPQAQPKQPSKPKPPNSAPECPTVHHHPAMHRSRPRLSTETPTSLRSEIFHSSSAMHQLRECQIK